MIVVTLELWRFGNPADRVRLGEVRLANDGTGTATRGHYRATFQGKRGRLLRDVVISDFPRRALTAFHLLRRALERAGY